MAELNIVIPSYDEYENLRLLIPELITTLDNEKIDYSILIIDRVVSDAQTRELETLNSKVKVINRQPTDCYGDAVRTGIKESTAEYTLFMDADGSHAPEFIVQLLKEKRNADIVIASRYIEGGGSFNGAFLKFLSLLVNLSYSVILNIPAKDVSNSFKLYKSSVLKGLLLKCKNFDIIEEILYKALKRDKKLKIKEIPYFFKERLHGTTKRNLVSFSFSFLATLIRLRLS